MNHPGLRGRAILVVEDELLIAMDIAAALEKAGANATMTNTVRHALILVEHDGLSGAIMDHALNDGDSTALCARLKERGIPYISYSGYSAVAGADRAAPHITKPVPMDFLMSALEELLPSTPRVFVGPAIAARPGPLSALCKVSGSRMKDARGLYRVRRIGGMGGDVRVTDGATEMDMPQSIYREWGCQPDCEKLPWKNEYDANSKPKAAVPKRPKRQKRPAK